MFGSGTDMMEFCVTIDCLLYITSSIILLVNINAISMLRLSILPIITVRRPLDVNT
jgi:hypothetical protein